MKTVPNLRAAAIYAAGFSLTALLFSATAMLLVGMAAGFTGTTAPPISLLAAGVAGPTLAAILFARLFRRERLSPNTGLPSWKLLLLPFGYGLAALLGAKASGATVVVPSITDIALAFTLQLLVVALLEEIGWRGHLVPVLAARLAPIAVALLVALAWFFWHLPKFGIGPLFVAMLAIGGLTNSILLTRLLYARGGGLVGCIVLHASFNTAETVIDPNATSMPAQYGAFAAVIAVSVVAAAIAWHRNRDWFHARPR